MTAEKLTTIRGVDGTAMARRQHRLDAYQPEFGDAIRSVARAHPAIADLAETFPALLFALATGYGREADRARALTLVLAGSALREASDALALPYWLRRLPPEAFQRPLGVLPADAEFGFRIASQLPSHPAFAAPWLQCVSVAAIAGGREFAVWMARHAGAIDAAIPEDRRILMSAWAWFSRHPASIGGRLLRRPFSPDIGAKRALDELNAWLQRVALADWLGNGSTSGWVESGEALGYRFEPMRTIEDFLAASTLLDNCLDQYGDHLRVGATSVYAVRKAGRLLACLEIGPHDEEPTMPAIIQLRARRNRRAPAALWRATYAWLGSAALVPFTADRVRAPERDRLVARQGLWQPYLDFLAAGDTTHIYTPRLREMISVQGPKRLSLRLRRPVRSQEPR